MENMSYVWRVGRSHICEAEYVFMHLDLLARRSLVLPQGIDMLMQLCVLPLRHVLNLHEQWPMNEEQTVDLCAGWCILGYIPYSLKATMAGV